MLQLQIKSFIELQILLSNPMCELYSKNRSCCSMVKVSFLLVKCQSHILTVARLF